MNPRVSSPPPLVDASAVSCRLVVLRGVTHLALADPLRLVVAPLLAVASIVVPRVAILPAVIPAVVTLAVVVVPSLIGAPVVALWVLAADLIGRSDRVARGDPAVDPIRAIRVGLACMIRTMTTRRSLMK